MPRFIGGLMLLAVMATAAAPKIDPESDQILHRIAAQFAPAKTAEMELKLAVKLHAPAEDLAAQYSLAIARPNKFALILKQGDLGASAISDGTNAITFLPKLNIYSSQPAPKDLRGMEGDANAPAADSMGSMAFIAALFSGQPYEALLAGVIESKFVGAEKVGEVELQRINFKQEGLDWALFVTAGERAEIRRITVDLPQMHMTLDFSNWRFNPELAPDRFAFVPPAGARKVVSVFDRDEEGEDSDLVGEALPVFKLRTIDGGTFDNASLKGKVGILVCWAGEAEHCVQALRATSDLAAANKGVVLFSINVDAEGDKTKVQSFLAKHKLGVKTAIDKDRTVADKLEVEGVPMTFLVDKAGTIYKAWLGYHQTFPAVVGKELDQLLGKSGR